MRAVPLALCSAIRVCYRHSPPVAALLQYLSVRYLAGALRSRASRAHGDMGCCVCTTRACLVSTAFVKRVQRVADSGYVGGFLLKLLTCQCAQVRRVGQDDSRIWRIHGGEEGGSGSGEHVQSVCVLRLCCIALPCRAPFTQLTWTPVINTAFFFSTTAMATGDLRAAKRQVEDKLWPTLKVNWVVWPVLQAVNMSMVPLQYRLLYINVCSLFWSAFLSNMAADKTNTPSPTAA